VFKTHLDIGFTGLSSKVEQQYIDLFIPKTLAVIDELRTGGAEERYVWTTGSWLIWQYLQTASPEAVAKLEEAIRRGDIVWNGMPYTVESEMMSRDLFETCLQLSQQLDRRFNKKTVAAKMTDVPGHTRSIVTPLADAGISFLHIGVNSASAVPQTPPVCRWKNIDGKEIVLMYQGEYGGDAVLPDGETVVSINLTNDNHGPHTVANIKNIYATARTKYPNAKIEATSLNEIAADLQTMKNKIPVFTSEIGDTWIHGFGSSPLRIARYRALSRLYSQWLANGKLDRYDSRTADFAARLGLIPEHTWGLDVKTFLKHWDKYEPDAFNAARSMPEFKLMEQSWAEIDANIDRAIALLPEHLQKTAQKTVDGIVNYRPPQVFANDRHPQIDACGAFHLPIGGADMLAGELVYQSYSPADYARFQDAYLRHRYQWAIEDFGKRGLENTGARSAELVASLKNCTIMKGKNTAVQCRLEFPASNDADKRVLPENIIVEYIIPKSGNGVELKVSLVNKPASRLPEAYLLSFVPSETVRIFAQKTGCMVDISDVAAGGNRQMHAIDNYIDLITKNGTVRISSLDAPLVVVGQRKMLNYSTALPDLNNGIHFCLFNNLWGTNFSMWWEGNITYRFKMEIINSDIQNHT
jgi:hypothetical protein